MRCFYIESPSMRMLLSKLRCTDYITLIAASSIIRPGVTQSGIMRTYIERFHIESLSGYSFAKGHSTSYAVESYQSLYLKAHYPLEFIVGVINNFGGFYKTAFYFQEARMKGASIAPPCVNYSDYLTSIYEHRIYVGFVNLKGFEEKASRQLVAERTDYGAYTSLQNFLERTSLGINQIRILIRIGAFRFTGRSKQQLLWEVLLYFNSAQARPHTANLFGSEVPSSPLPELEHNELEDGQRIFFATFHDVHGIFLTPAIFHKQQNDIRFVGRDSILYAET